MKVNERRSVIWLFFKIKLSNALSMRSRRKLLIEVVINSTVKKSRVLGSPIPALVTKLKQGKSLICLFLKKRINNFINEKVSPRVSIDMIVDRFTY